MKVKAPTTPSKGFSIPIILIAIIGLGSVMALGSWLSRFLAANAIVARVDGVPIPAKIFKRHLYAELWKRDLHWESLAPQEQSEWRTKVLNELIDEELMLALGRSTPSDSEVHTEYTTSQLENFLKQFHPEAPWQQRFAEQKLEVDTFKSQLQTEYQALLSLESTQETSSVTIEAIELWNPERVELSHIFLTRHDPEKPDQVAKLQKIRDDIVAKKITFEEAASLYSEDERSKSTGGHLGWTSLNRLPPSFLEQIDDLAINTLSQVTETDLGWHLIKIHHRNARNKVAPSNSLTEVMYAQQDEKRHQHLVRTLTLLRSRAHIELREEVVATLNLSP